MTPPENKDRFNFLKDISLFLALITGFCYFLSLAFKKGQNEFYGINDLVQTQLDINILINSFYDITSLLLKLCISYFVIKIFLFLIEKVYKAKYDDETSKGSLSFISKLLTVGFVFFVFPFFIIGVYDSPLDIYTNIGLVFRIALGLLLLMTILFFIFPRKRDRILGCLDFLEKENVLTFHWTRIKVETKFILIISVSLFLSVAFYHYGYTIAEQKDKYVVYVEKHKEYILLDKYGKTLIVSELIKGKDDLYINKNDIKLIELKNSKASFKNIDFENGLQVKPNERAEKLKGFLNFWHKETGN